MQAFWKQIFGASAIAVAGGGFLGTQLLIDREGSHNAAYIDQAGIPTICVGHVSDKEFPFKMGDVWTDEQCEDALNHDLQETQDAIDRYVKVPLTDYQESALRSFIFNIGVGGFKSSTLLRELNKGNYDAVPYQMSRWNKVTINGRKVVSRGLVNRRNDEIKEWNGEYE